LAAFFIYKMQNQLPGIWLFFLIILGSGCIKKSSDILEIQEYTGPIVEIGPAVNYYSDSAVVKMRMEAPRQLEFGNGDREFPEGLYLEFFENGEMTSTLRADYCYYTKKDDLYKATGNVVARNIITQDQLDTEELFWDYRKEEVFTDKFVRVEQSGELTTGVGLEAKQDFSYYKILEVQGTLPLSNQDQ
jgi:LPS export ABC transporter protein LptC